MAELTRRALTGWALMGAAGAALEIGGSPGAAAAAPRSATRAAATGGGAIVPEGVTVTRYTASNKYLVNVRSTASLATAGNVVAALDRGVAVVGQYNSTGLWFRVLSGTYAGRWMSSAVLTAQNQDLVNGRMVSTDLTALPAWAINTRYDPSVTRYLSRAAAASYVSMNSAFRARFGRNLTITEGYRTYATQVQYYRDLGFPRAAVPGTSNHGLGNAVDLGVASADGTASPLYYGHVYDTWLTTNGWRWGFDRPDYMDRRGSNPEWWHYNFTG